MALLNQGRYIEDDIYGAGRVVYTKGMDALVEFAKSFPHDLLPGVWSIKIMRTVVRDGKKKRIPNYESFGREDCCKWYDRISNTLRLVPYPDRVKKSQREPKEPLGSSVEEQSFHKAPVAGPIPAPATN